MATGSMKKNGAGRKLPAILLILIVVLTTTSASRSIDETIISAEPQLPISQVTGTSTSSSSSFSDDHNARVGVPTSCQWCVSYPDEICTCNELVETSCLPGCIRCVTTRLPDKESAVYYLCEDEIQRNHATSYCSQIFDSGGFCLDSNFWDDDFKNLARSSGF